MPDQTRNAAHPHEHVWDTETEEFSTFTPDPLLDQPWVIHECIEHAQAAQIAIAVARVAHREGFRELRDLMLDDADQALQRALEVAA